MIDRRLFSYRLVWLFLVASFLAPQIHAQTSTGAITGRVTDQNGNAVAGATVTARNVTTGASRSTNSGDAGEYTLNELTPGNYEIAVEAKGFARSIKRDFEVNVGSKPTLNFDLKAGGVAETVEVHGNAPLIETTRSEIGGVVTPTEVRNLPLLNRTFANLSAILPEARPVGSFDPTKTRVG